MKDLRQPVTEHSRQAEMWDEIVALRAEREKFRLMELKLSTALYQLRLIREVLSGKIEDF